jgi:hypothetical protein
MAESRQTVRVDLDADMVARARAELGIADASDTAVVERALNAYLLGRLLDDVQSDAALSEEEATRLANEELHAMRRERRGAA